MAFQIGNVYANQGAAKGPIPSQFAAVAPKSFEPAPAATPGMLADLPPPESLFAANTTGKFEIPLLDKTTQAVMQTVEGGLSAAASKVGGAISGAMPSFNPEAIAAAAMSFLGSQSVGGNPQTAEASMAAKSKQEQPELMALSAPTFGKAPQAALQLA